MLKGIAGTIGLSSSEEIDDPKALPGRFVTIYKNPYRSFGLDERSADISTVRDAFRKLCLSYIPDFTDLGNPRLTLEQINFAYHKIRGHFTGTAKSIAEHLDKNPYMDFHATDILPILRPMRSTFPCAKEYRGCRMLTVSCKNSYISFSGNYVAVPQMRFVFDVHYCMRRNTVEHSYNEIFDLHELLSEELVAIPLFPVTTVYEFVFGQEVSIGSQLAQYLTRIHLMLAGKGKFSPRLLKFLGLEFEKVQSEEEGIIMSLLDGPGRTRSSVVHIIDEKWLTKWRKFVMGRGARRYFPPGRISNETLIEKFKRPGKKILQIVRDYRCVSYNVWRFYELIHGGGPCISRKEEDIYSAFSVSHLQAIIMIQTRVRIFLAKVRKEILFSKSLLISRPVRSVLLEAAKAELDSRVNAKIKEYQENRKLEKLMEAAAMTQKKWRKKKRYFPEDSLRRQRADQSVFARTSALLANEAAGSYGEGVVFEEPLPIIRIGRTTVYWRKLDEEVGIVPFQIKRIPGSEMVSIWNSLSPTDFPLGSKLISINQYPCSSMNFKEVVEKLKTVAWPLYLELEKPVRPSLMPSIESIISMEHPVLQYNAFKYLLTRGLPLIKHSYKGKSHSTFVRVNEYDFFYRSASDPQKSEEQHWNALSLFDFKFIKSGRNSDFFVNLEKSRKKSKNPVDKDMCFEIVTEYRELLFELPSDDTLMFTNLGTYHGDKEKRAGATEFESDMKAEEHKVRLRSKELRGAYIEKIADLHQVALNDAIAGSHVAAKKKVKTKDAKVAADDDDDSNASNDIIENELNPDEMIDRMIDRGLMFPEQQLGGSLTPEGIYVKLRAATIVSLFQELVEEIRKNQNTVDDMGVPTRLMRARRALRNTAKFADV